MAPTRGHLGKGLGGQEAEDRSGGNQESKAFVMVSVRKARQRRVGNLGLASFNHFGGLWAAEVVSTCLIPGPGMMKAEEYCFWGQIEEV